MLKQLEQEWLDRFERLLAQRAGMAPTGLQCLERCASRCCPRVQMREMEPQQIASAGIPLSKIPTMATRVPPVGS